MAFLALLASCEPMRLFTDVREHPFSSAGFAVSFAVRGVPSPSCLGVDEQTAKKLAKDTRSLACCSFPPLHLPVTFLIIVGDT